MLARVAAARPRGSALKRRFSRPIAQVCRRCVAVAREPALWRRLLRLEFDLTCAEPGGADGARWRAAFRAAHAAAAGPAAPLAFHGAYTDGGCDGDGRYTVDALFSPAQWEPYWCVERRRRSVSRRPP